MFHCHCFIAAGKRAREREREREAGTEAVLSSHIGMIHMNFVVACVDQNEWQRMLLHLLPSALSQLMASANDCCSGTNFTPVFS